MQRGVYETVNFEIKKPLTIQGEPGAVLDGKLQSYIIKILADSVNIDGLKLINSGRSYTKDFAAIYLSRAAHFTVTNIEIVDPFFWDID